MHAAFTPVWEGGCAPLLTPVVLRIAGIRVLAAIGPGTGHRLFVPAQDALRAKHTIRLWRELGYWLLVAGFFGLVIALGRDFPG